MNRNIAIVAVAAIIVIGALSWYFIAQNARQATATNTTTNSTGNASQMPMSAGTSEQPATTANAVSIKDMAFTPADITVKQGATVSWTNNDSIAHTVTETDGQTGPDSSSVDPGATYSFTFTKAGTYHYHCSIHPSMTGTVTVTQS